MHAVASAFTARPENGSSWARQTNRFIPKRRFTFDMLEELVNTGLMRSVSSNLRGWS
jgi:hypothetical protein